MKKLSILLACVSFLAACAGEIPVPEDNGPIIEEPIEVETTLHMFRLDASSEGAVTKTTLDGDRIIWDEGDKISLVGTEGSVTMNLESGAGESSAVFVGLAATPLENFEFAVFPSNLALLSEDGIEFSIPAHQSYSDGSFDHQANVMLAEVATEDGRLKASFWNMMGVLQLSLVGDGCAVSEIMVSDRAGNPLSGTALVAADKVHGGIHSADFVEGQPFVVLDCDSVTLSEEPVVFNVVVPVGAFSTGFDVKVTTTDGSFAEFGSSGPANEIVLSDIKEMPVKSVAGIMYKEFNIYNPAVAAYMSYPDLPSFSAARSLFDKYSSLSNTSLLDQDRPRYLNVSWTTDTSSQYFVTLTDKTKGSDVYRDRPVGNASSYDVMNVVPGHKYIFKVTDGSKTIETRRFYVTGRVREVNIDDSWNWRDLGGWESTLGGNVKYEWLYRGGSLNGKWNLTWSWSINIWDKEKYTASKISDPSNYDVLSASSQQQIVDLGIKSELDLRSTKTEDDSNNYPHSLSLDMHHTGLSDWNFKRIKTADALARPLDNSALINDVEWIIDQVNLGRPVAFHCKSGADRTGALALVILAVLGVDEGDITRDYELTRFSHEQSVVIGKSEFRDRKASKGEVYEFFTKGLNTISKPTLQEKAYYYLTEYFSDARIAPDKLDTFINFMLENR